MSDAGPSKKKKKNKNRNKKKAKNNNGNVEEGLYRNEMGLNYTGLMEQSSSNKDKIPCFKYFGFHFEYVKGDGS